jgi:hypothetical protein
MMNYHFPISEAMAGSVIPGVLRPVQVRKIVSFPDHTNALKRVRVTDPVIKFPDMNQEHGAGHPVMKQLQKLLKGGGPEMRPGYEPFVGTRNWRKA